MYLTYFFIYLWYNYAINYKLNLIVFYLFDSGKSVMYIYKIWPPQSHYPASTPFIPHVAWYNRKDKELVNWKIQNMEESKEGRGKKKKNPLLVLYEGKNGKLSLFSAGREGKKNL